MKSKDISKTTKKTIAVAKDMKLVKENDNKKKDGKLNKGKKKTVKRKKELPKHTRMTKPMFEKALVGTGGILREIAKRCNMSRTTVYSFLERYPKYKELLIQEREGMVDLAEDNLFTDIKAREPWATKFTLKTLGVNRGYVEKQQIEHSGLISSDMTKRFEDALSKSKKKKKGKGL